MAAFGELLAEKTEEKVKPLLLKPDQILSAVDKKRVDLI